MITDEMRNALKAEIQEEHRQRKHRRRFITAIVLLLLITAIPLAHAKYVSALKMLAPKELDSITNVDLLESLYPVGCIYTSATNTNPCITAGVGTWEKLPTGRVLLGAGTLSGTTYTAGNTGGSAAGQTRTVSLSTSALTVTGSITLTGSASGVGNGQSISGSASSVGGNISVSGSTTLAATNLPSHTHAIPEHRHTFASHTHTYYWMSNRDGWPDNSASDGGSYWRGAQSQYHSGYTSSTINSGDANPNTSGSAGQSSPTAFSHSSTGTAGSLSGTAALSLGSGLSGGTASVSGSVSLTGSATVSQTGVADNTMQPYLNVYMWKRTA
ncbi:MAG: hypothetical protein LBR73_07450 [Oscillospiraceae bacterium]|jgi:hypothetical protein|nr:hypothetical protein [Oscillospiraceae bacterium]